MSVVKKNNIRELQRQTLINILSAKKIIYTHYKNKQKGKYENKKQMYNLSWR